MNYDSFRETQGGGPIVLTSLGSRSYTYCIIRGIVYSGKMGNIFYGYTGSVMGFSEKVLLSGSVYAARETLNDFEGAFEEFKDWVSIQRGVIRYKSKHLWNAIF